MGRLLREITLIGCWIDQKAKHLESKAVPSIISAILDGFSLLHFIYSASSFLLSQPAGQVLTTPATFPSSNQPHCTRNKEDIFIWLFVLVDRPCCVVYCHCTARTSVTWSDAGLACTSPKGGYWDGTLVHNKKGPERVTNATSWSWSLTGFPPPVVFIEKHDAQRAESQFYKLNRLATNHSHGKPRLK